MDELSVNSSSWDAPDNQEIIDKTSVFDGEQEEIKERMIKLAAATNDTKTRPNTLLGPRLQSMTVQLQLQQQLVELDRKLDAKKKEVKERQETCQIKWHDLTKRQKEFQMKVQKYNSVIEEGKIMRYRAMQRQGEETKELRIKEAEASSMKKELTELTEKNFALQRGIEAHQPYLEYLKTVYTTAPNGYFDTNVIPPEAVVKRHHAMILNGKYLHEELMSKTDEVIDTQKVLSERIRQHEQEVTMSYSKIAKLRKQLEEMTNKNISKEEQVYKKLDIYRKKNQELYAILSAIDNLSIVSKTTDMSKRKQHSVNPVVVKLKQIEDHILYKTAVVNHVKMLMRNEVERRISTTSNHTDSQSTIISSAGKISSK